MIFVTPNAQASVEGNGNNTFPFGIGNDPYEVPSGTQRYQQVYSASDSPPWPRVGSISPRWPFDPMPPSVPSSQPRCPTSALIFNRLASPDALSTTFANNVGEDDTIVYGGATGSRSRSPVRSLVRRADRKTSTSSLTSRHLSSTTRRRVIFCSTCATLAGINSGL